MEQYKIAVAGTGYVGLVTGVCFAYIGYQTICVDIDQTKIQKMKQGCSPIYEPDLEKMMQQCYKKGKLDYTSNYQSAYKDADIIFIGVGTPEKQDGSADLSYVFTVSEQIATSIEKDCLIVIKSTVPIGTNEKIENFIKEKLVHPVKIEVASNPEFLSQGTAIKDTLQAERIVIGTESKTAENTLKKLYAPFHLPIVSVNRKSAEMIKYACNNFLALKISYINDIANLCELVGANIQDVTKGMSYDKRIGNHFLKAGIGYGGSCFPKDIAALKQIAQENHYQLKITEAVAQVNNEQKMKLYQKAYEKLKGFKGLKVAVLGFTYKPGTDDLRGAPSIENIQQLLKQGANVYAYDPVGTQNLKKQFPTQIVYTENPETALKEADVCFIFTEWCEIKTIQPKVYKELMKNPLVYDGRNIYDVQQMKENGIEYYSIGR